MTTINPNQELKDFKGEPLLQESQPVTVGLAMCAILAGKTSNATLAWTLGKQFAKDTPIALKAEDIVFLKKEVETNQAWLSVVTGQLIEILDGEDREIEP